MRKLLLAMVLLLVGGCSVPVAGAVRWQRNLEGAVTPGPVIGLDGAIHASSSVGVLHVIAQVAPGVTLLQGEHAQLLVFLDQQATRGDNNQSSLAAAELTVTAQRPGDHWVITACGCPTT